MLIIAANGEVLESSFMRFSKIGCFLKLALAVVCVVPPVTDSILAQTTEPPIDDLVVANVGDDKICLSQVEWQFQSTFGDRDVVDSLANDLRTGILDQLVRQQLVLSKLSGDEFAATGDEVRLEISRLAEQAARNGSSLDEWLAENKQSRRSLQFNLEWQISWKRFTDATMTDDVLEKYFNRHRREFDGTRINVAHLLLPVPGSATADDLVKLSERATAIRQQIFSGELEWSAAVEQHSSAPTAKAAGELGWIEYDRPMPREFTQAAFALEPDEISLPVQSSFGVHLIKCLAVEAGTSRWYEIKRKIKSAAVQEVFKLISDGQRKKIVVQIADPLPWLVPASGNTPFRESPSAKIRN